LAAPPPLPPTPAATSCIIDPKTSTEQIQLLAQTKLNGQGTSSVTVTAGGSSRTLNLFGGLAVDPATNQAFVVQSGSGTIQIVNLGPVASNTLKAAEISETASAFRSRSTLRRRYRGRGYASGHSDIHHYRPGWRKSLWSWFRFRFTSAPGCTSIGTCQIAPSPTNCTFVSTREVDVTVPHSLLLTPHKYAVDVVNSVGSQSNVTDFFVIKAVDMTPACSGGNPQPNSVAIADSLPGTGFAPIAVVSNSGCNNISVIDMLRSSRLMTPYRTILPASLPIPSSVR